MKPTDGWFSQIFLNQRRIWSPTSGSGANTVYSSTADRMDKYSACSSCLELESLKEFSSYRRDRPIFILPSALSLYVLSLSPSIFPNPAPSSYPFSSPTDLPAHSNIWHQACLLSQCQSCSSCSILSWLTLGSLSSYLTDLVPKHTPLPSVPLRSHPKLFLALMVFIQIWHQSPSTISS